MGIPQVSKVKDESKYWNILLYADSGAGKTAYALKDKRVLVLAIGAEIDGLMSAARLGTEAERIKAKTWEDVHQANEDLWSEEGQDWLVENYDTLVIDSLTEADSQCMLAILRKTRAQKLAKDTDPDTPWIDDYGTRNRMMEKLVRSINDLPINVFWTALPRTAEDPDAKEFMVPMIGGNKATDFRFSMKLAALMTSFGYMRVETVNVPAPTDDKPDATKKVKQRVIYWEDTSFSKGKDRTIALAPKTINFTMQHMRLCIAGKIDREGRKIEPKEEAPAKKAAPRKIASSQMPATAKTGVIAAVRAVPDPTPESEPEKEPDQTSPVESTGVASEPTPEPDSTSPEPEPTQEEGVIESDDSTVDLVSVEP